jgi:hypothetical protein
MVFSVSLEFKERAYKWNMLTSIQTKSSYHSSLPSHHNAIQTQQLKYRARHEDVTVLYRLRRGTGQQMKSNTEWND